MAGVKAGPAIAADVDPATVKGVGVGGYVCHADPVAFHDRLPLLVPHRDARSGFLGKPDLIRSTAYQSGTLQGAYLIIAARALGLDCGPMGGFDNAKGDAAFFPEGTVKSNFLCNLGYGDPAKLHPRAPRLAFDDACRFA